MGISFQPQLMTAQDLFSGSLFSVPEYQRAYSWEEKQWDDLWEDVREGMKTETSHFLGTVVLMESDQPRRDNLGRTLRQFQVVDGQQRMTTLCLLLLALHGRLREHHDRVAHGLWRDFVEHEDGLLKIELGRLNSHYFRALVQAARDGKDLPVEQRSSNMRIRKAVRHLGDRISGCIAAEDDEAGLVGLASYVREKMHVLRFVTNQRPLAIKTFQTVNDRGKELSLLDKTKGFLMFYITRYLKDDEEAFCFVERSFSSVFDNYDAVRDIADQFGVDYLVRRDLRFNEDEFLRYAYHFGAKELVSGFSLTEGYEYGITPERVFGSFLKGACRQLRDQPERLREFVLAWCEDLVAVSEALLSIVRKIPEQDSIARFFRFQGPSASVYPLLLAAEARGLLDEKMLNAIAVLDLRVYQIRNTDPKAALYREAISKMKTETREQIYESIIWFCRQFGSDQSIDADLRGHVYRRPFAKYVLWQFAVSEDTGVDELDYDLYDECEMEHVLPDDVSEFDLTTFGFESSEEYESTKHGLGNLTPLERGLNNRAKNKPPRAKAPIYGESRLESARVLGARIKEEGFTRESQMRRVDEVVSFFRDHWPIPE